MGGGLVGLAVGGLGVYVFDGCKVGVYVGVRPCVAVGVLVAILGGPVEVGVGVYWLVGGKKIVGVLEAV